MNEWVYPILVILVLLDLSIGATRVSMLNARPVRLKHEQENNSDLVQRTLKLIENPRLRANLRMSQTLTRFLMAFLVIQLIMIWMGTAQLVLTVNIISLVLLAMLMLIIEFTIENPSLSIVRKA